MPPPATAVLQSAVNLFLHITREAKLRIDLRNEKIVPIRLVCAPEKIRELRVLVRHRQELADERRNTKLRVSALLRQHRQRSPYNGWTLNWLSRVPVPEQSRWVLDRHVANYFRLKDEIKIVERRLSEVTADNALVARLQSIKAIGPVNSWVIAAEIAWFDRCRDCVV